MAACLLLAGPLRAELTYSSSSTAPSVDDADIANLAGGGALTGGAEANWIFGLDRPSQGQTFTTGPNPAGYDLDAVTIQRATASWSFANVTGLTYRLRIDTPSGTNLSAADLLNDASASIAARATTVEGGNLVTDPAPLGYVTLSGFSVHLAPATTYSFDVVVPNGINQGWQLNATTNTNSYTGGTAFSSGDNGTPTNTLVARSGDRVFHLNLVETTPVGPPVLTGTNPADDATNVPASANLVASFDKVVQAGTGSISLKRTSDNVEIESFDVSSSSQLSFSGSQLTIDPAANLTAGVEYYVLIPASAVKDASDNFFAGITTPGGWSFTTDGTAPTVVTLSPADDATNVLTGANLVATFDEAVQKGTGNITLKRTSDNSTVESFDVVSSSQLTFSATTVTINPTSDLASSIGYYVQIDNTAVKDLSGNPYTGIADTTSWSFTTVAVVQLSGGDVIKLDLGTAGDGDGTPGATADWNQVSSGANITVGAGSVKRHGDAAVVSGVTLNVAAGNILNTGQANEAITAGWSGLAGDPYFNNEAFTDLVYAFTPNQLTVTFGGLDPSLTYNLRTYVMVNENRPNFDLTVTNGGGTIVRTNLSRQGLYATAPLSPNLIFEGISPDGSGNIAATTSCATFGVGFQAVVLEAIQDHPPGYDNWAAAQTPPLLGGPAAVGPDGLSNLMVYALDLKTDGTNGSAGTLAGTRLSFAKRAEAVANGDVTYAIEESDDLGQADPWTEISTYVENSATTISCDLPPGKSRTFVRLVVRQQ